jgi:hypothetical protein
MTGPARTEADNRGKAAWLCVAGRSNSCKHPAATQGTYCRSCMMLGVLPRDSTSSLFVPPASLLMSLTCCMADRHRPLAAPWPVVA